MLKRHFSYAFDESSIDELKNDVAADCIHPTIKGHKAIAKIFWETSQHLFDEEKLLNYDFSILPEKCENEEGYGKKFWCDFGFCAKKSIEFSNSEDESSLCRVTKY